MCLCQGKRVQAPQSGFPRTRRRGSSPRLSTLPYKLAWKQDEAILNSPKVVSDVCQRNACDWHLPLSGDLPLHIYGCLPLLSPSPAVLSLWLLPHRPVSQVVQLRLFPKVPQVCLSTPGQVFNRGKQMEIGLRTPSYWSPSNITRGWGQDSSVPQS